MTVLYGSYEREKEAAIEAARAAGRLVLQASTALKDSDVLQKGSHDLVTRFDREAQSLISDHLLGAFPNHHLIGEESPEQAGFDLSDGFVWIVDPIDGTTNFSRGVSPFAVSIGLAHEGDVVLGVVLEPTLDELFVAVRGEGVSLNGEPATCSRTRMLDASLIATGFPYRAIDHLPAFLEVLGAVVRRTHGFRRVGSAAVDLAYVAVGRFDAFYETGLMSWDMAAGRLMVEEAGGRVTDFDGLSHALTQPEIVASNGHVHDELVSILEPLRRSRRHMAKADSSSFNSS